MHPPPLQVHRHSFLGFLDSSVVKNFLQCRKPGLDLWVRKILWRRAWQPTPVFLPGKSHGQGRLAGCSPYNRKRVRQNFATKQHFSVPNSVHRQMALYVSWTIQMRMTMNVLRIASITCFIFLFSTLLWIVPQLYPHNNPGRWVKMVLSSPFYKEQEIEVPVLSRVTE